MAKRPWGGASYVHKGQRVQRIVMDFYRMQGCFVESTSRYAGPTRVTAGLPDLKVFHFGAGITFWHESKGPGGTVSPSQKYWHAALRHSGEYVAVGDVTAAERALADFGLGEIDALGIFRLTDRGRLPAPDHLLVLIYGRTVAQRKRQLQRKAGPARRGRP